MRLLLSSKKAIRRVCQAQDNGKDNSPKLIYLRTRTARVSRVIKRLPNNVFGLACRTIIPVGSMDAKYGSGAATHPSSRLHAPVDSVSQVVDDRNPYGPKPGDLRMHLRL